MNSLLSADGAGGLLSDPKSMESPPRAVAPEHGREHLSRDGICAPRDVSLGDIMAEVRALRAEVRVLQVQDASGALVDAARIAAELGVSRQWVYQNRDRLGAIRVGSGPKGRLRFDIERARQALQALPSPAAPPAGPHRGRRKARASTAGSILRLRP
jgi:hypothetical protein